MDVTLTCPATQLTTIDLLRLASLAVSAFFKEARIVRHGEDCLHGLAFVGDLPVVGFYDARSERVGDIARLLRFGLKRGGCPDRMALRFPVSGKCRLK